MGGSQQVGLEHYGRADVGARWNAAALRNALPSDAGGIADLFGDTTGQTGRNQHTIRTRGRRPVAVCPTSARHSAVDVAARDAEKSGRLAHEKIGTRPGDGAASAGSKIRPALAASLTAHRIAGSHRRLPRSAA